MKAFGDCFDDPSADPTRLDRSSLRVRTIRGAGWNFASAISGLVFQFGRAVVLARLLVPEDFGIVGMATGVAVVIAMFADAGLTQAVVQADVVRKCEANFGFWAQTFLMMLVALLLLPAAPWIARFYRTPQLSNLFRILILGSVLTATLTVPIAMMLRNLRFRELNIMWGYLRLLSLIGAVAMAAMGCRYWSLVIPDVVIRLIALVILLIKLRWLPGAPASFQEARSLFSFSSRAFANTCLATLNNNIDYILLGRFYPASVFGLYYFGFQRVRGPLKLLTSSMRGALFPALSRMKQNPKGAYHAFHTGTPLLSVVLFPVSTTVILTAPQFVPLVFGHAWIPATPFIQMFTIWAYFIPINLIVTAWFISQGKLWPMTLDLTLRSTMMAVGLATLAHLQQSIYMSGWYVVVLELIGNSFLSILGLTYLGVDIFGFLKVIRAALASSLAVIAFDAIWWSSGHSSLTLIFRVMQAAVVAAIVTVVVDRPLLKSARSLIAESLPNPRKERMNAIDGNAVPVG